MAQSPKLANTRIDSALRVLEIELSDVPWRVSSWSTRDDAYKVDYALQWDEFEGLLEELSDAEEHGDLSPAQITRYQAVLTCYAKVRTLLVQAGLDPISLSMLATESRP